MALREILAKFGFDIDDSKLKKANTQTDSLVDKLNGVVKIVTGGLFVAKTREWINEIGEQGDALAKGAVKLGVNAHALQQWQVAADMAGVSAGGIELAMKFLQKNAVAGAKEFAELGIAITDASGKTKGADVLMREVGLAISSIDDPAKRTNYALQLLGKQGADLAPLFADGAEGLDEALRALDDFGGGLSDDLLPLAESYGDRLSEMNLATLSFKNTLGLLLFPSLISSVKWLSLVVVETTKWLKGTESLKAVLVVATGAVLFFARTAIMSGLKTALAWAPIALVILGLTLLVDDLITMFNGGDSAVGRLLDSMFGAGTAQQVVKDLTAAWVDFGSTLDKLPLLIAGVAAALVVASSPILATAAAVTAVVVAIKQFQDQDKKTKGQGAAYWWTNAKHNLGITSDEEYAKQRQGLTGESDKDIERAMNPERAASLDAFDAHFKTAPASLASANMAPSVKGTPRVSSTNNVQQRNEIKVIQHIDGGKPTEIQKATSQGIKTGFDDERRAMLAVLESG